jgi:hypothetical protein
MHPSLKKIVFRKLNQDLSKVEIIVAENKSIWFIDRANKYWYFELEKSGKLWWRYEFFTDFFSLFCLEVNEFQPLLSEWVEGILNRGVASSNLLDHGAVQRVERVLNSGVITSVEVGATWTGVTEGVLNHGYRKGSRKVDEVLNREINEIDGGELFDNGALEKVLNHKVVSISHANEQNELIQQILVHELIYEVESATPLDTPAHDSVDEVLSYKVTRTIPDLNESLTDVEIILNQNP